MDTAKIETALGKIFHEEGHRIVFWNDPDREFYITLGALSLEGVNVLRLDETGAFQAKIRMERDDPDGKYLVYDPNEEPEYDRDWLLDMRLYGRSFRADRASLVLDELGLERQHLRQHIAARRKFFDNKDRIRKLKALVQPDDNEDDLDRKMMAVVLRADQPELLNIVRTAFHAFVDGGADPGDLSDPPEAWQEIEKYDLDGPFWTMARAAFGYEEENPSLRNLLIRMLVTDFANSLGGSVPDELINLVLSKGDRSNSTVLCLAQWRDSSSKGASYDTLSGIVGKILKVEDCLPAMEVEELLNVMTFLDVEKVILSNLRDRVMATADTIKADEVRSIAAQRQDGHWANANAAADSEVPRQAVHAVYDALTVAADFFDLRNRQVGKLSFETPKQAYEAYVGTLYRFDQLYRQFCESANIAEAKHWDVLKKLRQQIEANYDQGFIDPLAMEWGKLVDPAKDTGLLKTWRIDGIPNQQRFFDRCVQPVLAEGENRRVFVIISDAFRYEAAEELATVLNGKYRLEATLSTQLGVLPSYTSLGMAALLPHKTLEYRPAGEVVVDGQPTASLDQRSAILAGVNGVAVKADDLMAMKKEDGREFVKGRQVIYVYHNTVDLIGDDQKSEGRTFAAVRQAIDEINVLVSFIIDSLNGNHVVITADHGFLFSESALNETDKSVLDMKPSEAVKKNKRFMLGQGLPDSDLVWHGRTSVTANAGGDMEFWLPRGTQRFYFTGGARFVHGGAMPQEVVVPIITVKHKKDKGTRGKTEVRPVPVQVLGTKHRVTTGRHRFELIQMEPVSERVRPVTLKVGVYEGSEAVTDIQTVTFESASDKMDDRKIWVHLTLRNREYDKKTLYRLVLHDAATGVEQANVDVTIDRAFTDDF